jgi:hypothetical protein
MHALCSALLLAAHALSPLPDPRHTSLEAPKAAPPTRIQQTNSRAGLSAVGVWNGRAAEQTVAPCKGRTFKCVMTTTRANIVNPSNMFVHVTLDSSADVCSESAAMVGGVGTCCMLL